MLLPGYAIALPGLLAGLMLAGSPAAAQAGEATPDPVVLTPATPEESAPVTLVGRKGEPVEIVDHRTGTVSIAEPESLFVNRMTAEGMIRQEVRALEVEEAAEAAAEAKQAEAEEAAKRAEEAAERKAVAEAKAAEAAREQARLAQAEASMRGVGWQPWTPDGKILFNPNTFQFQPRDEVVERFLPPETP